MTRLEELQKFDLTDEERQSISNIIQTPGWQALEKVWKHQSECNSMSCRTVHEDHRFWQGYANGFDAALDIAIRYSKPHAVEEKEQEPSEAQLVAKVRRMYSDTGNLY